MSDKLKFYDPQKVTEQILPSAGLTVEGLDDPDMDEVQISGYACRYEDTFVVFEMPGFRYLRMQKKGSFKRSLSQNPKVLLRLNHQQAFANTKAGTLTLEERADGLFYSGMVSKQNPEGMALLVEMARGTLDESSIAYQIARAEYEEVEDEDGNVIRTQIIVEGDINKGDVSVVQFGMNPNTSSWIGQSSAMQLAADDDTVKAIRESFYGGLEATEPPVESDPDESVSEGTESNTEAAESPDLTPLTHIEKDLLRLKMSMLPN